MAILGLHHVQITIPRAAETTGRDFYCGVLQLTEIDKPASLRGRGGFWLQLGDRQLHVGVEDGVDRARTKAHVALEVDDLESWRGRLREHGVTVSDSVPIPGVVRFEVRDPFGNRLEFLQRLMAPQEGG